MNRDDITYEIVSFAEYYSKFYNEELAWKLAEIASDNAKLNKKSIEMVGVGIMFWEQIIVIATMLTTGLLCWLTIYLMGGNL